MRTQGISSALHSSGRTSRANTGIDAGIENLITTNAEAQDNFINIPNLHNVKAKLQGASVSHLMKLLSAIGFDVKEPKAGQFIYSRGDTSITFGSGKGEANEVLINQVAEAYLATVRDNQSIIATLLHEDLTQDLHAPVAPAFA